MEYRTILKLEISNKFDNILAKINLLKITKNVYIINEITFGGVLARDDLNYTPSQFEERIKKIKKSDEPMNNDHGKLEKLREQYEHILKIIKISIERD